MSAWTPMESCVVEVPESAAAVAAPVRDERSLRWLRGVSPSRVVPARLVEERVLPRLIEPLTQRETQILNLICNGDSNQEIAEQLRLSINAVKFHLQNIFGKLGVRRRTQAVAMAVHLRLVVPAWLADPVAASGVTAMELDDADSCTQ